MSVNLYGWFSSQGACPLKLIPCEQQPGTILKKDSRDLVEFIVSEGYGVVKYSSSHPKPIKLKAYSPKPKLYLCQVLKSSKIRLEQNVAVKLESQKNGPSLNNKNTKTVGGGNSASVLNLFKKLFELGLGARSSSATSLGTN